MTLPTLRRRALAAAIAALSVSALLAPVASAQDSMGGPAERAKARAAARAAKSKSQEGTKAADKYPNATRKAPTDARATSRGAQKLQKMMKSYDDGKLAEARAAADEIIADDKSNAYERAFAAQIAAQGAYEAQDVDAAIAYLRQAIGAEALDNTSHFNAMYMMAQLQMSQDKYADALATLERFTTESGATAPEYLAFKGNALYRLERYPEAITALRAALDATTESHPDWQQLLMAAYAESGQGAEAAKMAEAVAAKNPADKRAQMNLVATYLQTDDYAKAAAVLERLRAAGQLVDDRDYRQLYATYLNMEGKEKDAAAVIDEGLKKGALKPDYQTWLALAQAYYFSDQLDKAIGAYQKAAPLAPDGETYLNLARALWSANRIPEAKQAAQQAQAKGVKKADDIKRILALPGK